MKLLNPNTTIQNTDTNDLLLTMRHAFSEHESLEFTVLVDRENTDIKHLHQAALLRLQELTSLLAAAYTQK